MDLQSSVAGLHGYPEEGATAASLGHKQSLIIRKERKISKSLRENAAGLRIRNDGSGFVRVGTFIASGVNRGDDIAVSGARSNDRICVGEIRDDSGKRRIP